MNEPTFDEAEFGQTYERSLPGLENAARRLVHIVSEVVSATEQQRLARAKILDEPRIKDGDSVSAKARRAGWGASDAVTSCDDIVGVRVVCNNVDDVRRFVDLLLRRLAQEKGGPWGADGPLPVEVDDHVSAPKRDGYRAVHVKFRLPLANGRPLGSTLVGCEVQIRTLLQDSWARLSHKDAYKTEDLPEDLRARFRDLSLVLAAADGIAQDIRDRIAAVRHAPEERPDLRTVTDEGIAYLYASTFGRNPTEYAVTLVKRELRERGVQSLEGFEGLLADVKLRERVERAYATGFRWGGTPSSEDVFFFTAVGAARGARKAVREARRHGKAEGDYVDTVWRSEVTAELPAEPEAFLRELESGDLSVDTLAELFGARSDCSICGADIVDADAFEEGASSYYDGYDFDGRVSSHLHGSGIETGGFSNSSLCSYHDHVMSKDD